MKLAYRLTLPGTPHVRYGDEIGLVPGGFMKWDDSKTGGFTEQEGFEFPVSHMNIDSVLVSCVIFTEFIAQNSLAT